MELNGYRIYWALFIDENNVMDFTKSFHGATKKHVIEKIKGKKGRFFIITDKQFGLIQSKYKRDQTFTKNTNLSVHLEVENKYGYWSMVPLTKKQFENPIIL